MNLKTLSAFKCGFYESINLLESNLNNRMSLDVYKRSGILSTVQLGLIGFSHGQSTFDSQRNMYNSYGVTMSSGVGVTVAPTQTRIDEPF